MTLAQMRARLTETFERNLVDLDGRDIAALADASTSWMGATAGLTKESFPGAREALADLVANKTAQASRWFVDGARLHVATELTAIADDARLVANSATAPSPDFAALEQLGVGLVDRLAPLVEASNDVPATLAAEVHQVERIVQSETFALYNRTRAVMSQALLEGGDRSTYVVHVGADVSKDASDWVPGILKRWSALLDGRACKRCKELSGEVVVLGMAFGGEPDPPLHARCRCVVGFWPIAIPKKK